MNTPVQITYRNLPPSDRIDTLIHERAAKLDRLHDRITSGRVVVEAPHRRRRSGNPYQVRVDVTIPGGELFAAHESDPDSDESLATCVREAFNALERELQSYAQKRREAR